MNISKSPIFVLALILTYSLSSQAQLGALLPGKKQDQKQEEEEIPFFDNRFKKQKPVTDKPAPSKVIMHNPSYAGSGCPEGTTSVAMSGDNRAVSIIFDQFMVEAGSGVKKLSTEKTCRLVIPIEAPKGFRMAVAQMDYRGFNALPENARAKLTAVHQIRHQLLKASGKKVKSQKVFEGPIAEDFFMSAVIANKPIFNVKSQALNALLNPIQKTCGGTYNLDVTVSISVLANPTGEQAMITLDSIDGQVSESNAQNSVAYHLQWEQCQ